MIGQNIGVTHLLPLALSVLQANPLAAGDFYEGDLLNALIHCDEVRKCRDKDLLFELVHICREAIDIELAQASETFLDGHTADELDLTQETMKEFRQDCINKQLATQPLLDFKKFCEKHS